MHRTATAITTGLILGLAFGGGPGGPADVRAGGAPEALAAAGETPPRAPRAPRAASPKKPTAPPAASEEGIEAPEAPSFPTPRGWFGFGFQCGECGTRTDANDSVSVWTFSSPPQVYSVDLGSPAARAGLRRGDLITRIDGVSILSADGGRRFGSVRPGQKVKWTVVRDGVPHEVVAQAAERPDRRERVALTDLRRELMRLNDLSNVDELRREIAKINRQMELRRAQESRRDRVRTRSVSVQRLRFAGVIGGTEVEVRGAGPVVVSESDEKDELIINTGESIVVIRVPESMRKREGSKPKE